MSTGRNVSRALYWLPFSEKLLPFAYQSLNHPADHMPRSFANVLVTITPTLRCGTNALLVAERSMNTQSVSGSSHSWPAPTFCRPILTRPTFGTGISSRTSIHDQFSLSASIPLKLPPNLIDPGRLEVQLSTHVHAVGAPRGLYGLMADLTSVRVVLNEPSDVHTGREDQAHRERLIHPSIPAVFGSVRGRRRGLGGRVPAGQQPTTRIAARS